MRFGNASTTVTGTVTPASVNTRVIPHLRPTRPMVIVDPHTAGAHNGSRFRCNRPAVWALETPGPLDHWRRHPLAPTFKIGRGSIPGYALRATSHALRATSHALRAPSHALRAPFNGADAAPQHGRSLRER